MKPTRYLFAFLLLTAFATSFAQGLTLYVGRGEALAGPIIERFEAETGVDVVVRYGSTAELAVLITEEGAASPADGIWAQDAGALGALARAGLLAPVPDELFANVAAKHRVPGDLWVPVSARNRTLVYSTQRVDESELPESVFDLTDPGTAAAWPGRPRTRRSSRSSPPCA